MDELSKKVLLSFSVWRKDALDLHELFEAGGNDFIAKPFLFIELSVKALIYVLRAQVQAQTQRQRTIAAENDYEKFKLTSAVEIALSQKDIDRAMADYDEAIRRYPNYAEAFDKRGHVGLAGRAEGHHASRSPERVPEMPSPCLAERSVKLPGPPAMTLKLGKRGWWPRSASAVG
jgi:tetratricopeptide (TPR) repeat protein